MVAAVFNGAVMAETMVKWCRRITRGHTTSVVAGPQVMLKAAFTLDESRVPQEIDYVNLEGANARKRQAGIVEMNEGILRICMSAPGKPRPREFASKPGDGRSYTTWRLVKIAPPQDARVVGRSLRDRDTDTHRTESTVEGSGTIETKRLLLRRPQADDAAAIFERYAGDPDVTRFVGFRRTRQWPTRKRFSRSLRRSGNGGLAVRT